MKRATVAVLMLLASALAGCGRSSRLTHAEQRQAAPPPDPANIHTVTVKFDYDFTKRPTCAQKPTAKTCIKQFDVYDVSGGVYKLFAIPAPANATGVVKGITAESPSRAFEPGKHFIAVTAEDASGAESDIRAARTSVEVERKTAPSPSDMPARQ